MQKTGLIFISEKHLITITMTYDLNDFENKYEFSGIGIRSAASSDNYEINNDDITVQSLFDLFRKGGQAEALINKLSDVVPTEDDKEKLLDFVKKAVDTPDKLIDKMKEERVFDTLRTAGETLSNVNDVYIRTTKFFRSTSQYLASAIVLYYLVATIRKPNKSNIMRLIAVTFIVYAYDSSFDIFSWYKHLVSNISTKLATIVSKLFHSGDDPHPLTDKGFDAQMECIEAELQGAFDQGAVDLIFATAFTMWCGLDNDGPARTKFMAATSYLSHKDKLAEFVEGIVRCIVEIYNSKIASYFGGMKLPFNNFEDPKLRAFDESVEKLVSEKASGKLALSIDNYARIVALLSHAKDLYEKIPGSQKYSSTKTLFLRTVNTLEKMKREFDNANVHLNGFRQEPVGILIRGPPGAHKSTILSSLSASMAAAVLPEDDYKEYLKTPFVYEYNRQAENIYMDGYSPRTITVLFDDIGQIRDIAGNPDGEWMNIIRFINSFECMGHSANIDQKGVLRIRPKFVMATTNQLKLRSNAIESIDAVNRRFPISIIATPKLQYCEEGHSGYYDRKFSMSKLPQVQVDGMWVTDINMTLFDFYDCDKEGNPQGSPYDYDVLVSRVLLEYKKREKWVSQHLNNFLTTAAHIREKFYEEPSSETIEPQSAIFKDAYTDALAEFEFIKQRIATFYFDHTATFDEDFGVDKTGIYEDFDYYPMNDEGMKIMKELGELQDRVNDMDIDDFTDMTKKKYFVDSDRYYLTFAPLKPQLIHHVSKETKKAVDGLYYNYYNVLNDVRSVRRITSLILTHSDTYYMQFKDQGLRTLLEIAYEHDPKFALKCMASLSGSDLDYFMPAPMATSVVTMCRSLADIIKDGFKSIYSQLSDFYERFKFDMMMTVSLIAISGVVMWACDRFLDRSKDSPKHKVKHVPDSTDTSKDEFIYGDPEPQAEYEQFRDKSSRPKVKTLRQLKESAKFAGVAKPQGADLAGDQLTESIVKNNVAIFKVQKDDKSYHSNGYGIILKKGVVLIPLHFISQMVTAVLDDPKRKKLSVKLIDPIDGETHIGSSTIGEVIESSYGDGLEESHMVLVKMNTRDVRDISKKYFVSESIVSKLKQVFYISAWVPHRQVKFSTHANLLSLNLRSEEGDFLIPRSIHYQADTYKGDCGAPLFVRNAKLHAHRIIGFHVAGSNKIDEEIAFAAVITQEDINKAIALMEEECDIIEKETVEIDNEVDLQSAPTFLSDRFRIVGKVKNRHSPYGFTSIKPSILQSAEGDLVSHQRVAMLRPTRGIDPYQVSLANYCANPAIMDLDLLSHSVEDFKCFLFSSPNRVEPSLLSLEEALWGSEDVEFSEAIKSSTSAGYPIKYDKDNIKKALYSEGMIRDATNPRYSDVKEMVDDVISDASLGIRQMWVYTDNLKDARVSLKKYAAGKGRLFSGAPFIYLVVFRIYFGRFMHWIHENSIKHGMVTAINPFSLQWDEIAFGLKTYDLSANPMVCDGDFSHYDGSMLTDVGKRILDIINEWYSDGNEEIRRVLWMEVTNSRHIFDNYIYEWHGSLASGNPITLIVNCMNNQIIHRYCFYSRHSRILKFHECVKLYVTGDDLIMAVKDEFKATFNGISVQAMMSEIGYVYTSASKDDTVVAFKRLSEATFLKRGFRFEPTLNRYVGPLDLKSILEIPLWTKKHDSYAILLQNLVEFFDELSLHSASTWEMYAPKYQRAVQLLLPGVTLDGTIAYTRAKRLASKLNQDMYLA